MKKPVEAIERLRGLCKHDSTHSQFRQILTYLDSIPDDAVFVRSGEKRDTAALLLAATRIPRIVDLFWRNAVVTDGCWQWRGSRGRKGYARMNICIDNKVTSVIASRFSWALHNGEIGRGLFVCHKCDNPECVNPAHLFTGTAVDNMRDRDAKGRHGVRRGSAVVTSRLTEDAVRAIRRRAGLGERQCVIAKEFGVSQASVSDLLLRKTWDWLEE